MSTQVACQYMHNDKVKLHVDSSCMLTHTIWISHDLNSFIRQSSDKYLLIDNSLHNINVLEKNPSDTHP